MKIENTKIEGVKTILSDPFRDERGFFNRIFCQEELSTIRPNLVIVQINHSMTKNKGTIRGMHFQYPPHSEMKIVRCVKGSIFDVAIDLRKGSPTFLQWHGEVLSVENMKALVVPEGCAHGVQTLEDNVEMVYMSTAAYCKEAEGAVRYDDPKVGVRWPLEVSVVSQKDAGHALLDDPPPPPPYICRRLKNSNARIAPYIILRRLAV
ncbi:dTDP-4-dehydrorhamnose 3,5-epimerase [Treponema primitia]|uniref:dTDP-4-dehydrorhamnose 3,5-epimerase n=1 Tax=Treponema primitia TaxID=88058 RepID=UPI003980C8DF